MMVTIATDWMMNMKRQPSEEMKAKIVDFFLKTSVPRILEKESLEKQKEVIEAK